MVYCTKTDIENYLDKTLSKPPSDTINEYITAAQNIIDNYCRTTFESSVDQVKYYDGNGQKEIDIDPFTGSITTLKILDTDGTTLYTLTEGASSDFITWPYNTTEKFRLILVANSQIGAFLLGRRRLEVTARFRSDTAVPKPIKLACIKLVAALIEESPTGKEIKSESLGDYSVTYMTEKMEEKAELMGIYNMLDQYRQIIL